MFTYDLATAIGQVRMLIGDTVEATAEFSDEEIQAMLTMSSDSVLMAAALACDNLATKSSAQSTSFILGDFQQTAGSTKVSSYKDMAARFRELEYNTPAFAIAEENLSNMNALVIIRNYVMRTEG